MLRQILAPVHPDGWKFIAAAAIATVILFILWAPLGWIGLIATLWMAYFFRDPWRVTPTRPGSTDSGLIVSPADGIVVALTPAPPPPELEMGVEPVPRIGIFLNLFDVHVARAPVGGRLAARRYTKGRFVNASLDKASEHNERLAIRMITDGGSDIAFVLIAGLVARRIVCWIKVEDEVAVGERIGMIRFGSRLDVYLPPGARPEVREGQTAIAGETVIARARPPETGERPVRFG